VPGHQGVTIAERMPDEFRVNRSGRRQPQQASEGKGHRKAMVAVLRSSDQVQRDILLYINGRYFEAPYYLEVALAQFDRLCCLFLSHSRVVHCDFVER
jgi:hypothetical protein